MLGGVDDEHDAELRAPFRTQGHQARGHRRQLFQLGYPHIATVFSEVQGQLFDGRYAKQTRQTITTHQDHRLRVGRRRQGSMAGQRQ